MAEKMIITGRFDGIKDREYNGRTYHKIIVHDPDIRTYHQVDVNSDQVSEFGALPIGTSLVLECRAQPMSGSNGAWLRFWGPRLLSFSDADDNELLELLDVDSDVAAA